MQRFLQRIKMMELTKKSRKIRKDSRENDKFSLPTRDDFHPIDTEEQEKLVRYFEQKQARESALWRGIFAAILVCFAAFYIFSIYRQFFSPWELRYHSYFMEDMGSWAIISADWMAVLACLMAARGIMHDSKFHKRWLQYSSFVGILLCLFWLFHMLRMPKFRWDVLWLPFGPLSGAGMALYINYLLGETHEEVQKLRGSMYSYKIK